MEEFKDTEEAKKKEKGAKVENTVSLPLKPLTYKERLVKKEERKQELM